MCKFSYKTISVPSVVDVGYCLVGGCHVTQLVVKNEGGPGRFCIMPSAVWPTTNFKVIRQHPKILLQPSSEQRNFCKV